MKAFFKTQLIHNQKVFIIFAFSASEDKLCFTIFTVRQKKIIFGSLSKITIKSGWHSIQQLLLEELIHRTNMNS